MTIADLTVRLSLARVDPKKLRFLTVAVIYDHPRDYPGYYVVRRWKADLIAGGNAVSEPMAQLTGSLESARRCLPVGAVPLGRMQGDDPMIAEVWLDTLGRAA